MVFVVLVPEVQVRSNPWYNVSQNGVWVFWKGHQWNFWAGAVRI